MQSEADGEMLVVFFLLFWQEKSKDQELDTLGFQPLAGHLCRCDRLRGCISLWRNGIKKTARLASSKAPVLSSASGAWLLCSVGGSQSLCTDGASEHSSLSNSSPSGTAGAVLTWLERCPRPSHQTLSC